MARVRDLATHAIGAALGAVVDMAVMVFGSFIGWYGIAIRQNWSMLWRGLGPPEWLANTDLTSDRRFVLCFVAVCRLLAPGATIPRHTALRVGAGLGLVVAPGLADKDEVMVATD